MSSPRARKLFWILLLIVSVSLVITACGGAAEEEEAAPAETGEEEMAEEVAEIPEGYVDTSQYAKDGPYTFCFSNASVSNSWRVSMVEHLYYEVEQHPEIETLLETDANDDPAKQISDTEDLLAQGCDILIISPATEDALTPVVEQAMDDGVPVVTLDRNISSDNYVSYVTSSNCDMGTQQAEWLIEALGGEGQIVMMAGLAGASPAEDRLSCAREAFEATDIEILEEAYTSWSPVEGKQVMENWITTYGDEIDGVWSGSGLQASGAIEAFVEAGMDVPPISGEDFNLYFTLWQEIGFEGVSVSFPVRMGGVAVTTALDVLAGEPVPHTVDVERTVVTIDNLDDYARPDLPADYWADSLPEVADRLFP
jgi:ribose transport system substrate-binding protein